MTTHYQYVHETVWLPTYLAIVLFVLGTVPNSTIATLVLIFGLVACRVVLELLYRMTFGDTRLTVRNGLLAFGSQLVLWGLFLGWFLRGSPAI
jgi:hypothetical protein